MVMQKGDVVYEGYAGWQDKEKGIPVTDRTLFRQASMSKLPLYTTMMMLYEDGCFHLTDPISDFFPEWAHMNKVVWKEDGSYEIVPTEGPVLVRDVLSMTCGLPYCNFDAHSKDPTVAGMEEGMRPLWQRGYYTIREQIKAESVAPLAFEPGTQWMYGFASELAAGIIEEVCGKSIDDVFKERIYDPLGMADTRSHYEGDAESRMIKLASHGGNPRMVEMLAKMDEKFIPGPEHQNGWARLYSSPKDFSKLMQMLANGGVYNGERLLGRKTIDMMRTNGLTKKMLKGYQVRMNLGYGYGFGVRTMLDQNAACAAGSKGAFGWTGGFGTWCEADPKEGVSIVYMHNLSPNEEDYYHPRVRAAAYGLIL